MDKRMSTKIREREEGGERRMKRKDQKKDERAQGEKIE